MKRYSQNKIKEIKLLRKQGSSINEIVLKTGVPKTSVWHHVKDIKISKNLQSIIRSKQGGSKIRKEKNIVEADIFAKELLLSKEREKAVIISMLHWAEGSKKVCEFINSDGKMVSLYLLILRKMLQVREFDIVPTMRIFTGMNKEECLSFWVKTTGIERNRFKVRLNDGGTSGKTKYGMCRITVKKGQMTLKVFHALKENLIKDYI